MPLGTRFKIKITHYIREQSISHFSKALINARFIFADELTKGSVTRGRQVIATGRGIFPDCPDWKVKEIDAVLFLTGITE